MASQKQPQRIFYGWRILAASLPLIMISHGLTRRSYGLFFEPLQDQFGWSAAAIALVFSLDTLEGGLLAPLTGYLTDRLGGRKMVFIGTIICGLGFLIASQIQSLWQFYAAFMIINTGGSVGGIMAITAVMARWFDRYLGRALGILNAAPSLGSIMLPIMATIITISGWRTALFVAGIAVLLSLPLCLFIRPRPEDYGLLPDGGQIPHPSIQTQTSSLVTGSRHSYSNREATIGQALRTSSFWLIAVSVGLIGLGHNAVRLLTIPHLQANGFSREVASATIASSSLVAGLCIRPLMGWIADQVNVKKMYPLVFLLQAISLLILANVTTVWQVLVFVAIFEVAFAAHQTFQGVLIAKFFGVRRYASIGGLMRSVGIVMAVIGPVMGGAMFDFTGSYRLFFHIMGAIALLGIPPIMLARQANWQQKLQGSNH